jgi:hypothetical protein
MPSPSLKSVKRVLRFSAIIDEEVPEVELALA